MMEQLARRNFVALGGGLMLAACAPRGPRVELRDDLRDRFEWRIAPPDSAGMAPDTAANLRDAVQRNIDAKLIAGAVTAVARRGKLVSHEAQGFADVAAGTPMTTDSLFRMMSSSKVVTAVAVMMMVEEGRIALEDPVSRFIPSFRGQKVAVAPAGVTDPSRITLVPAGRDITVKDLLTHTSGLSSYGELINPGAALPLNKLERSPNDSLADIVPKLGSFALDFQPGSKWRYSPLDGMDVLLYLVELVSGQPADRFVAERILQPLDMRSTYYKVPTSESDRIVKLYAATDGKFVEQKPLLSEAPARYVSGAGGLISTAHDFLNFELMLLGNGAFNGHRLLRAETVSLMSRNQVGTLFAEWIPFITGGMGFGLGVGIVEDEAKGQGRTAGAFGWGGAYGTESWADPKLEVAAVMLIQMSPAPPGTKADFAKAIRRSIIT